MSHVFFLVLETATAALITPRTITATTIYHITEAPASTFAKTTGGTRFSVSDYALIT